MTNADLKRTPLHGLHVELGARMVPFAGYDMPVQFEGVLAEHNWTRAKAGLFDVSHMGQARLRGDDVDAALETLVPADVRGLDAGRQVYSLLLNAAGGIRDDLMISKPDGDGLFLVVNAAVKEQDFAHISSALAGRAELEVIGDRALLALQGPAAAAVMAEAAAGSADLKFMDSTSLKVHGIDCLVSRSGYTGEDGFEISVPAGKAETLARAFLVHADVKPIGLGARDSLRLEAGLCLYGHDIDDATTPIEASLTWTIAKNRRDAPTFPGGAKIVSQITEGAAKKRVGLKLLDKAPAREGAEIHKGGVQIGVVTSGGFGPTVGGPIAMGYVDAAHRDLGTQVDVMVRGTARKAEIVRTPFAPHRYHRG